MFRFRLKCVDAGKEVDRKTIQVERYNPYEAGGSQEIERHTCGVRIIHSSN
jgi:hypothetical protein